MDAFVDEFDSEQKTCFALIVIFRVFPISVDAYYIIADALFQHFTARLVCIARTMPSQDVCLSVRSSVTRRYGCTYPQTFFTIG